MSDEPKKAEAPPKQTASGLTKAGPILAVLVIALGIGLMYGARYYKTQNPPPAALIGQNAPTAKLEVIKKPEKKKSVVPIGGPFTLTDHNGQQVTEKTYAGQYKMVFFGYTFCPDVCPTTLTTLSDTMDILGESGKKVTPIFISVDPARDTPDHLKEYVGYFHPSIVALTGTDDQIRAVTKAYRVYYAKAKATIDDPEDYLVDHSSITYLIGPDGFFVEHFSHGVEAEEIAERLLKHL